MSKLLLTIKEAKLLSGLSHKEIMRYISTGSLKYINSGAGDVIPRYKIMYSELTNFLERLQVTK